VNFYNTAETRVLEPQRGMIAQFSPSGCPITYITGLITCNIIIIFVD